MKLLCLVLNRSEKEWKMGPREWTMAKAQFAVIFGERFTKAMAGLFSTARPHTRILTLLISSAAARYSKTYGPPRLQG